jgi:protein-disulfide isomerase
MSQLTPPIGPYDHVHGDHNALVTLAEYGDYECRYCGRAHGVVQRVLRAMGRRVRFAFRHFPLAQVHPRALLAAEAAEAAGEQGKFWLMHDMLFEHQGALEPEDLVAYAETLLLDTDAFTRDLSTHRHLERVRRDFRSGVRSGVNGTPTFFINGERFDGSWDEETLIPALDLAAARGHDPMRAP